MVSNSPQMKVLKLAILGLVIALFTGMGATTAKADTLEYTISGPTGNYGVFR